MIIWSGLGFLVVVFFFGSALACNFVFDALLGKDYYSTHRWTIGVAMIIAAQLCWIVGNILRKRTAQPVIDKTTGEEFVIHRGTHDLFFMPMHWWGPILLMIGVVLCVAELVG